MALHVFGHVKANQIDAHDVGQLLGRFGFTNTRGATEQEGTDWFVAFAQARTRHLDGRGQNFQGFVLSKHHALEVTLQGLKLAAVVVRHIGWRNTRNLGDDVFDLHLADGFLALGSRQDALGSAGFVDHVNCLVWQVAVIDIFGAQFCGGLQCGYRVFDVVVLFKAGLEAFEDVDSLFNSGLYHIDLLETTRQGGVFLKNATVFGEGGRTNAFQLTARERGLEQIRCVQCTARRSASADQSVDFVDEQNSIGFALQGLDHAFEALLEVTAVFGTCQQSTHVERINNRLRQDFWNIFLGDTPCEAFGDSRFTYTCFTDQ